MSKVEYDGILYNQTTIDESFIWNRTRPFVFRKFGLLKEVERERDKIKTKNVKTDSFHLHFKLNLNSNYSVNRTRRQRNQRICKNKFFTIRGSEFELLWGAEWLRWTLKRKNHFWLGSGESNRGEDDPVLSGNFSFRESLNLRVSTHWGRPSKKVESLEFICTR